MPLAAHELVACQTLVNSSRKTTGLKSPASRLLQAAYDQLLSETSLQDRAVAIAAANALIQAACETHPPVSDAVLDELAADYGLTVPWLPRLPLLR